MFLIVLLLPCSKDVIMTRSVTFLTHFVSSTFRFWMCATTLTMMYLQIKRIDDRLLLFPYHILGQYCVRLYSQCLELRVTHPRPDPFVEIKRMHMPTEVTFRTKCDTVFDHPARTLYEMSLPWA